MTDFYIAALNLCREASLCNKGMINCDGGERVQAVRILGVRQAGRGSTVHPGPAAPAAYSEALLASWVPPLPEIRAAAGPVKPLIEETKPDVAAFLARVYLNQQC